MDCQEKQMAATNHAVQALIRVIVSANPAFHLQLSTQVSLSSAVLSLPNVLCISPFNHRHFLLRNHTAFWTSGSLGDYSLGAKDSRGGLFLAELRQENRSVTDYSIKFRTLDAECRWNLEVEWDMFLHGLADYIKDEIYSLELPTSLDGLVDLAIRVDKRLQQRDQRVRRAPAANQLTHLPVTSSDADVSLSEPEPMQMGRSRLSLEEKRRRRNEGLCLYCGAAGHIAAQCPVKARAHQLQWSSTSYDCQALIDSGAEGNYLDSDLAYRLKLPVVALSQPIAVHALNGLSLPSITHTTGPPSYKLESEFYSLSRERDEHMDLSKVPSEYLNLKTSKTIRPSSSPAGAGGFFVKKKDGSLHPCIDYRGLNNITVKNRYPLPLMSSALECLQGASFFTKLDLRNAYHLVCIREGDEWKAAFNTPRGHFEYCVLPFWLSNAPTVFQALVNNVLRDMLDQFIYVYPDDKLIFSHSLQEHVQHVMWVLQRLLENGLYVKVEKWVFHVQSVPFLGYIMSVKGLRMDPDKIQAVVDWPTSDSRNALQRFLGFANFYQRFICNFSQLAAPLTALTSTKTPFRWSSAAEAAFAKLKSCFVSAPILIAPDPSRKFVVEVDASEVGVGAVLSQRSSSDGSKNIKPDALSRIFDHSECLSSSEPIVPQKVFDSVVTWETESKVCTASQGVTPPPGCPSGCLFVPESLRSDVIRWGHCSKTSNRPPAGLLQPLSVPSRPWSHISLDFVTGLPPSSGKTVVLTVVDQFSKATHFIALPKLPSAR
ncbi:Transposon Tf2-6 polyprotein [Labeo rohita]|uniref:ribonuclease H n=1 Tax=Labeo rohita TaxID=84645 RepID=A0ABQ8LZ46_LABRO|nr:Transposon Tf2-6 polyprotein [Labeo rohita]